MDNSHLQKTMKTRRAFIRSGVLAGASLSMSGATLVDKTSTEQSKTSFPALDTVRVGFVGIGVKGSQHLGILLHMEGVEIVAVCDVLEDQCKEAQTQAMWLGKRKPTAYYRGEYDFLRMCQEEDLDLVYTATPWRWHSPICMAAMENGSHAATEIPMAITLEECWQLVETSERTGKHCVMMENVNYMEKEMAMLRMIREGLLGEVQHAEASYAHDTRYLKIKDTGDGLWLGDHHALRNGNLYPPHAIGPVAWYMDINRGDRLDYLVSMSCNAKGMDLYAAEHLPVGHPKRMRKYINGDVNCSLIRTINGKTMMIKHDTDLPRPYSRTNMVQGTRGIIRSFPDFRACFESNADQSDTGTAFRSEHKWESAMQYAREFEHPLWKFLRESEISLPGTTETGRIGHNTVWEYRPALKGNGGDFLVNYRLIQALLHGVSTDYDVYDGATWSAVSALSEWSVANRSRPIDFPDFTKGRWMTTKPAVIMGV